MCAEGGVLNPRMPAAFQNTLSLSWERKGAGAARVRSETDKEAVPPQVPTGLGSFSTALLSSFPSSCVFLAPETQIQQKGTCCSHLCVEAVDSLSCLHLTLLPCQTQAGRWKSTGKKEPNDTYKSPAASVLVCGGVVHTREIIQVCKTKLGHTFYNHLC